MSCSNCYNGCAEIVSDRCVRYTGIDVPSLGITNGDSLFYVEQVLTEFLISALNGTGVKPVIDPLIICDLVKKYLPTCGDLNVVDFITALIKAACDLQEQVTAITEDVAVIEADYDVDCLPDVSPDSGTHAILQAVITKLCELEADFAAFVLDVTTNYVKKSELCSLVDACIAASTPAITQQYQKMVPYTVVEYYGPLSNFDGSGAGLAALGWDKIYLCNGNNFTPDKRGRIPVGAIQGVGGGALNPVVDPGNPGNPNYALNGTAGANTVTLTTAQIPSHTHTPTVVVTETPHSHFVAQNTSDQGVDLNSSTTLSQDSSLNFSYTLKGQSSTANVGLTNTASTNVAVSVTNATAGSGGAHANIPPVLACYYIMYIP